MKTVKTYLVRKPSDIEEVETLAKRYANMAEDVLVTETIELTEAQYKAICDWPLNDYDFLTGKGGYDDEGNRTAIELTCKGKPSLYADPSGSSYCRYLGIKLGDTNAD